MTYLKQLIRSASARNVWLRASIPLDVWSPCFDRIEEWLRETMYSKSTQARHYLLDKLQEIRVMSYADYCIRLAMDKDNDAHHHLLLEAMKHLIMNESMKAPMARIQGCKAALGSGVWDLHSCSDAKWKHN